MKFRYYITDTFDGAIKGTNDLATVEAYSEVDDYFVVDTETGEWMLPDKERVPIQEIESP